MILACLADDLEAGVSWRGLATKTDSFSTDNMNRLCRLGAVEAEEDEFGDVIYRLRPAGITWSSVYVVHCAVPDVTLIDPCNMKNPGKLEMLFSLYSQNFRPIPAIEGTLEKTSRDSDDRIVLNGMLGRSAKYFEALMMLNTCFRRGLTVFHHGASHYYYTCLIAIDDLTGLMQIENPSMVHDDVWKGILKAENPKALMDAEAVDQRGRDDGPEGLPALPAAPKGKAKAKAKARAIPAGAIVERPAVLEAMNFRFDCGEKSFLICLDGYSHQSGRRRVYAKCPIDGHIDCYWYTFLHQHRFPWQAVAYILGYITKGVSARDKVEHKCMDPPSAEDIAHLTDVVPIALLADIPSEN